MAKGIARYDGVTLRLELEYADGKGSYTWPLDAQCRSQPGRVTWSEGQFAGKSVESTLLPSE